ncbi:HesA/MoeB/ThiF family protein [Skermanella pratensis]|uniref:HesA/MoeB/ThiF family protein n=1 Tax=Skermanella pratensis TaxID=2233999 RepID=UPI001301668B|nr:ThiF family adenylyltransferase [Skermanella pratensis]
MTARYHRHNLIDWFSQDVISKTRVAVIGAGAVGNEVIKNLCLLGVGEIHIFDFDYIEEHNLTRSVLFRETDIGMHKAEVAAWRATELDPNVQVKAVCGDFWDTLSVSGLKTFDALFCCVDNFEARIRCNTLCYLAKTNFINVGIDSRSVSVETYPFSSNLKSGCIECNLPETVYRRISERYSCGYLKKVSFVERKVATTIITSSIAGSFAVSTGLRLGTDADEASMPNRLYVDTIAGNLTRTTLAKRDDCPCCGRIPANVTLIRTKRDVRGLENSLGANATVVMSEPILVGYRLLGEGASHIIFRKASEFDDGFPATLASDPGDVEMEVRDQFTLAEIAERFDGHQIPSKFAVVETDQHTLICEFDGDEHE